MSNERTRKDLADETYHALFGPGEPALNADDPELGDILRKVIFGDVFRIGDLDHRTREILTVAVLTTLQALPQLRGHVAGALRVGVTPVELREVIYQCVGFIGFPALQPCGGGEGDTPMTAVLGVRGRGPQDQEYPASALRGPRLCLSLRRVALSAPLAAPTATTVTCWSASMACTWSRSTATTASG